MFSSIRSATVNGVSGRVIEVEVHTSGGFPGYTVVGMPDVAMRESKERIRSSLHSSKFPWPESRITVNLAPADVRKSGTGSELAIMVGLLCCGSHLDKTRFKNAGVIGELGLDGSVREISGTLARVIALKDSGIEQVFLPSANAYEGSLVDDIEVFPIESVTQLVDCLTKGEPWPEVKRPDASAKIKSDCGDYQEIIGQSRGCDAMMLLAAGSHHSLLMGSPGIGKTMLAERLPSILPELTDAQSYEVSAIESVVEGGVSDLSRIRPLRQPHHGSTIVSLIGGGSTSVLPGEVTRAHRGILFLDELAEFSARTLDHLRQPLEKGTITVSRANFSSSLPAQFTLVACSNPCPCAKTRDKCICSDIVRQTYLKKLSGPLLDRFDIRLELVRSSSSATPTHNSKTMREKVHAALEIQKERYKDSSLETNSNLRSRHFKKLCPIEAEVESLLKKTCETREISLRGANAIARVARTFADLETKNQITKEHLMNAFDMREEIL